MVDFKCLITMIKINLLFNVLVAPIASSPISQTHHLRPAFKPDFKY